MTRYFWFLVVLGSCFFGTQVGLAFAAPLAKSEFVPDSRTFAYKNLITSPKPWPAEKLGILVRRYPTNRFFRVSWRLSAVRFNQRVSVLYDHKIKTIRYDSYSEDWPEGSNSAIETREALEFHKVTLATLRQLQSFSAKNPNGSSDGHFFHLSNLGVRATYLHSSKEFLPEEVEGD